VAAVAVVVAVVAVVDLWASPLNILINFMLFDLAM
jgi:hypothetical protein